MNMSQESRHRLMMWMELFDVGDIIKFPFGKNKSMPINIESMAEININSIHINDAIKAEAIAYIRFLVVSCNISPGDVFPGISYSLGGS